MTNVALEFKRGLLNMDEVESKECLVLFDYYKNPKFSIPKEVLIDSSKLIKVYKNRVAKFIDLYEYLSQVDIKEKEIEYLNEFLNGCSQVEAEVFIDILSQQLRICHNIKPYKELGSCTAQLIPRNSNRLVMEFTKVGYRTLRGHLNKKFESNLKEFFKTYEGVVDMYQTKNIVVIHDIWCQQPTFKRLLKLSSWRYGKYIMLSTPYYLDTTVDAKLFLNKGSSYLFKPIRGDFIEVFKGDIK